MIFGWLVMAVILIVSVFYVLRSVVGITKKSEVELAANFSVIRRKEIEDEVAFGRISPNEAQQLEEDLTLEETAKSKGYHYVLNNRMTQLMLAIFVVASVLGSVSLYEKLGFHKEVAFTAAISSKSMSPEKLSDFLTFRANKYGRAEDWYFVAQDFLSQNDYLQALPAFDKALAKMPGDEVDNKIRVLVEYAQAIFYANGQKVNERMKEAVDEVLLLDPNQATALGLKGIAEFDSKNYIGAITAWQKAIVNGQNPNERSALLEGIRKARETGNISEADIPSLIKQRLSIQLDLSAMKSIDPRSVFLVYARLPDQPMPIAIKRLSVNDITQIIELTNLDNLMPGITLADAKKVDIIVKLAKITDTDLTQGKIIGSKKGVFIEKTKLLIIPVSL
jgi:cytochrome c-type biogenesis protein CcmH